MKIRTLVNSRSRRAVPALVAMAFVASVSLGSSGVGPLGVGSTVPDLVVQALDGSDRVLSERDGPTVLVFFRGVW